jgi:hypothetical protein
LFQAKPNAILPKPARGQHHGARPVLWVRWAAERWSVDYTIANAKSKRKVGKLVRISQKN